MNQHKLSVVPGFNAVTHKVQLTFRLVSPLAETVFDISLDDFRWRSYGNGFTITNGYVDKAEFVAKLREFLSRIEEMH